MARTRDPRSDYDEPRTDDRADISAPGTPIPATTSSPRRARTVSPAQAGAGKELPTFAIHQLDYAISLYKDDPSPSAPRPAIERHVRAAAKIAWEEATGDKPRHKMSDEDIRKATEQTIAVLSSATKLTGPFLALELGIADIIKSLVNTTIRREYYRLRPVQGLTQSNSAPPPSDFFPQDSRLMLFSYELSQKFGHSLSSKLRDKGFDEAQTAKIVRSAVAGFERVVRLETSDQIDAAAEMVVTLVAGQFGEAAKLALPERAPEIWMERYRSKCETPVAFLDRVWGHYMNAGGILFQDDIKRLGDSRLVKAVRTYCHRHGLKAADVLPPPQKVKLERALAEADPDSPVATALRARLEHRKIVAKARGGPSRR